MVHEAKPTWTANHLNLHLRLKHLLPNNIGSGLGLWLNLSGVFESQYQQSAWSRKQRTPDRYLVHIYRCHTWNSQNQNWTSTNSQAIMDLVVTSVIWKYSPLSLYHQYYLMLILFHDLQCESPPSSPPFSPPSPSPPPLPHSPHPQPPPSPPPLKLNSPRKRKQSTCSFNRNLWSQLKLKHFTVHWYL